MSKYPINRDYYSKFGLDVDPFPEEIQGDLYFITPELNHRTELIKHLLEFSQQLIVVTAPHGSGVTSIINNVVGNVEADWLFSRVVADKALEVDLFYREIVKEVIDENSIQTLAAVDALNRYLEYCDRNQKFPVLLIDNGHKLSIKILETILQLNDLHYNNTKFRCALFGDEKLIKLLEDPRIKISTAGILHNVNIPPLTREQTSKYIEYRLLASGELKEYPFTEKQIGYIYKGSGGIPGKINLLARQSLSDPETIPGMQGIITNTLSSIFRKLRHPVVLGIVSTLLLAAYFVLGDRQIDEPEKIAINLPPELPSKVSSNARQNSNLAKDAEVAPPLVEELSPSVLPEPTKVLTSQPTADSPAELPVEEKPVLTPVVEEALTVPVVASNTELSDKEKQAEPEKAQQVPDEVDVVTTETAESVPEITPSKPLFAGVKGSSWFQDQQPGDYVLQLIGARDKATLEIFIQTEGAIIDKLASFTTYNEAMPWYVLVYGIYPDRDSAAADIANLPPSIQAHEPWPRSIASIKTEPNKNPL